MEWVGEGLMDSWSRGSVHNEVKEPGTLVYILSTTRPPLSQSTLHNIVKYLWLVLMLDIKPCQESLSAVCSLVIGYPLPFTVTSFLKFSSQQCLSTDPLGDCGLGIQTLIKLKHLQRR